MQFPPQATGSAVERPFMPWRFGHGRVLTHADGNARAEAFATVDGPVAARPKRYRRLKPALRTRRIVSHSRSRPFAPGLPRKPALAASLRFVYEALLRKELLIPNGKIEIVPATFTG